MNISQISGSLLAIFAAAACFLCTTTGCDELVKLLRPPVAITVTNTYSGEVINVSNISDRQVMCSICLQEDATGKKGTYRFAIPLNETVDIGKDDIGWEFGDDEWGYIHIDGYPNVLCFRFNGEKYSYGYYDSVNEFLNPSSPVVKKEGEGEGEEGTSSPSEQTPSGVQ